MEPKHYRLQRTYMAGASAIMATPNLPNLKGFAELLYSELAKAYEAEGIITKSSYPPCTWNAGVVPLALDICDAKEPEKVLSRYAISCFGPQNEEAGCFYVDCVQGMNKLSEALPLKE